MSKNPDNSKKTSKVKRSGRSSAAPKRGLGRGLSALMEDVPAFDEDLVVGNDFIIDIPDSPSPKDETVSPASPEDKSQIVGDKTLGDKVSSAAFEAIGNDVPVSGQETAARPAQSSAQPTGLATLAMDQLVRNPDQPRKVFDKAHIDELAESIRRNGVLQPILVRPVPDRSETAAGAPLYQIVAGERRWQAAGRAGIDQIPVLIRAFSDEETLEIGVVENVQRQDLTPIEEATAYNSLIEQFGRTQEEIAQAVGKSRSHIANAVRLLTLPHSVQSKITNNELSAGHARSLIGAENAEDLAEQIIKNGLSVRETERLIKQSKMDLKITDPDLQNPLPDDGFKSADIRAYEDALKDVVGARVDLRHKGPGGEIRIRYTNLEDLEHIRTRLMQNFKMSD